MKHKLLVVLGLVAVVVLTACSVRAYDHYKAQVVRQNQAAQAAQTAKNNAARAEADRIAAEKLRAHDACVASTKAYDLLTTAQKAKATKPNCTLAQVQ